ncbi:MAG: hypothetical protein ACK5LY_09445 [Lachnospirales bacterium]
MFLNKKFNKHMGASSLEIFLVIGVLGVMLFVFIPIFTSFIGDSKDARTYSDFKVMYRSVLSGIYEWDMSDSELPTLNSKGLDSSEKEYSEHFEYIAKVLPYTFTLDEPYEGDNDSTTWRVVFTFNEDKPYDIYIYNGEYVSVNSNDPILRQEFENLK